MKDSLNYILQRIEYRYLQNNKDALMSKDIGCLQDEDLPCNCITGIVVNYSAYLTGVCLSEGAYTPAIETEDTNLYYIQCRDGDDLVCPVIKPTTTNANYTVNGRLCRKSQERETYVSFRSYAELERIENELTKYAEQHPLNQDKMLYLEFWIQFLSVMRVQPLNVTSRTFLFMAIYLFPNRTLKLIRSFREEPKPEWLEGFMKDYLNFLHSIDGSGKLGFQRRFVKAFKTATHIDISRFVESLPPHSATQEDLFIQTLISAYIHNIEEVTRRSGLFRWICLEYLGSESVRAGYDKLYEAVK